MASIDDEIYKDLGGAISSYSQAEKHSALEQAAKLLFKISHDA